ncbi:hypothetical protein PR048_009230 [Dryococelus australis]|uniref:PiggyBac transposable element-derived protein domain-containing protein n=1 Tax=Dryococelus australis TaxID=614101 RepID=A0ABQ9HZE3_9NEOP|nr:hypothetical protein PR048_009230 [Dryococelus australis]
MQGIVLKLFSDTCMQMITLQCLMETKTRYISYSLFQQVYKGTRELSIDESIILFKGRYTLKHYSHMKPIKSGYKLWAMAYQRCYTLAFKVYQGKDEVVLELLIHVWGSFRELYFYNYFSSPSLLERLTAENTHAKESTDDKKLDR